MMLNANVCNHVEVKNLYAPKLTFDEISVFCAFFGTFVHVFHELDYNM